MAVPAEFEERELKLDQGELLFAYTDGLIEARRAGEVYGHERLAELVGKRAAAHAPGGARARGARRDRRLGGRAHRRRGGAGPSPPSLSVGGAQPAEPPSQARPRHPLEWPRCLKGPTRARGWTSRAPPTRWARSWEPSPRIDLGRPSRAALGSGHYANVLRLDERRGLALSCDGVGTKVIVCEELRRFDTVGIDLVAMNANDIVCVGAEPIALLDYVAVEEADPETLGQIGEGLRRGAELAGIEIPGGELAVLPELIRGHPSPNGFDLAGFCVGLVDLDAIVTGASVEPGDAIVGLPSSGIHSNGLTLARSVLTDLEERPAELGGASVGETLLEPTVVYVRAVRELLESAIDVRGLAHITGEGFLNLLRLEAEVGYRLDALPEPPAVFQLIAERGPGGPGGALRGVQHGLRLLLRGAGRRRRTPPWSCSDATIPAPRWWARSRRTPAWSSSRRRASWAAGTPDSRPPA